MIPLYKFPTRNHFMTLFQKTQCVFIFIIVVLSHDMTSTKGIEFSGQGTVRFSPDFPLPGYRVLGRHIPT